MSASNDNESSDSGQQCLDGHQSDDIFRIDVEIDNIKKGDRFYISHTSKPQHEEEEYIVVELFTTTFAEYLVSGGATDNPLCKIAKIIGSDNNGSIYTGDTMKIKYVNRYWAIDDLNRWDIYRVNRIPYSVFASNIPDIPERRITFSGTNTREEFLSEVEYTGCEVVASKLTYTIPMNAIFQECQGTQTVLATAETETKVDYRGRKYEFILPKNYTDAQYELFLRQIDFYYRRTEAEEYDDRRQEYELKGYIWFDDGSWAQMMPVDNVSQWVNLKRPDIPPECNGPGTNIKSAGKT